MKKLKIETSAICNARCIWCWMFNSNKVKQGLMSFSSLKKIIDLNKDFLRGRWCIEPYFKGEALMNPELFNMLDCIVKEKIDLASLDTNLSIKMNIKKLMSYPWRRILVNIGGITKETHEKVMRNTDFNLVIKNIKEAIEINKDIIFIKMNPAKYNIGQLPQLKHFFGKLGGKPKNVIDYKTGFILPYMASACEKKHFFKNVVSEKTKPYLRFEYDLSKKDFGIKAKRPGCNWLATHITFDGKVTLCCHDQLGKINVGNAFITPLEAMLNSNKTKAILKKCKRQEFHFCKECN